MSTHLRVGPGAAAGVTEQLIHDLVHGFYAKIRIDPALGPIFNRVIGEDWDDHLQKMCDFWSSVLLMTGRFKGAPMAAHARIPDIRPTHFARWLHVFQQTARDVCPPEAAAIFVAKAGMIAESLQLGIAASRNELPTVGPRDTPSLRPSGGSEDAGPRLPTDVQPYRRTAEFTEATVPPALLKAHATKEGAWGLIHVLSGRLRYRIDDPRRPSAETVLSSDTPPGVVEPTILHAVEPLGAVQFFVEFHRREPTS